MTNKLQSLSQLQTVLESFSNPLGNSLDSMVKFDGIADQWSAVGQSAAVTKALGAFVPPYLSLGKRVEDSLADSNALIFSENISTRAAYLVEVYDPLGVKSRDLMGDYLQANVFAKSLEATRLQGAQRHAALSMYDRAEPLIGYESWLLANSATDRLLPAAFSFDPQVRQPIFSAQDAVNHLDQLFRRPEKQELSLFAREAWDPPWSIRQQIGSSGAIDVLKAVGDLRSPWARLGRETESLRAVGDLMTVGKRISLGSTFDRSFTDHLRSAFGDWRDPIAENAGWLDRSPRLVFYREQGVDPSLSDFPPATFQEILVEAELDENSYASEIDDEDLGRARLHQAYERLLKLERTTRRFIEREMRARFGDDWVRTRLPNNMLEGWERKRGSALAAEQPASALIDYADFTEYKGIIEKKENWKEVFQTFFKRPEDVRESFQRLFPLRIAIMHARFISNEDEMLLVVESGRLMKAFARGL